jgi:hypothetical protein
MILLRRTLRNALAFGCMLACALASGCGKDSPGAHVAPSAPAGVATTTAESSAEPDSPAAVAAELGMPASFENEWGMRLLLVPGGTYSEGDGKTGDPAVRHDVNLFKAFYLQDAKVTRGQWARFAGGSAPADADAPVTGVSYTEALSFLKWLCAHDERWTYRLPTEAEWDRAWLSGRTTAGAEEKTPWGLRSMTLAPAEWCFDWFEPFPDWPVMSPRGPENGEERVLRPGPPEHLAGRRSMPPDRHDPGVGLRVAVSLGYGGDDRGKYRTTFRTKGGLPGQPDGPELSGYQVRVVAIIDRLMARQIGLHYSWALLSGTSSPITVKLVPGIYYAQCQRVEDGEMKRGMEVKFGVVGDGLVVDLPIPQKGAYLQEPE